MGGGGDFGSGSGSKFNCAARIGSGQTISGTGRVRASVLSPCRPLSVHARQTDGTQRKTINRICSAKISIVLNYLLLKVNLRFKSQHAV